MKNKELTEAEKERLEEIDSLLIEKLKLLDLNTVSQKIIDDSELTEDKILEIRKTYLFQKAEKKLQGGGWDFWEERVQVENLLCQRFNFLIVCYSLFIAAFAVITDRTSKLILLCIGCIVIWFISIFVRRAWFKLDYNLKCLFVLHEKYNGIQMIDEYAAEKGKLIKCILKCLGIRYNQIIGSIIPNLMWISLAIGILAITLGWWDGGATSNATTNSCKEPQVTSPIVPPYKKPTYYYPKDTNDPLQINPIFAPK